MRKKDKIEGISIQSFVEYYLGTKHNCFKLKHQGLKSFDNPYVIGVSNDFALKNPDYIMKNELIVVIDDYGNPGTYINPHNIKKLLELEICKEKLKLLANISCHNFEEANILYQFWMNIIEQANCIESLYGNTYELLYMVNKYRILRGIKKLAKEEAKRTLLFSINIKDSVITNKTIVPVVYEDFSLESVDDVKEIYKDPLEDYEITEKVNRQKKLGYY